MSSPEAEFEKYKGTIIDKVLRERLAVDAFHNIFINVLELRTEQSRAIVGENNDFFRKIVGGGLWRFF